MLAELFAGPGAAAHLGAGLGAGITLLGLGYGISRIGAQAMDGMARQPEASGAIRGGMIVAAALIEGAGFFSLIVCIILAVK